MKTRLYKTTDYPSFVDWWSARWGGAPDIQILPQSGIVVESDGVDIAAGWVYLDLTASVAIASWVVTNPLNSDRLSAEAVTMLIGGLIQLAKSQGRSCIMTACPSGSLSRAFESCGFESKDKDIEHLTLNLI
ncbi:hypothetical protein OAI07_01365 [Akkermansiaceae bacterium]|nr:hypothetical protein [Akkermansiaceae bacterium]